MFNSLKIVPLSDARKPVPDKSDKKTSASLTKLITSVLGEKAEGPTEFEISIQAEMESIAKQENGEYDKEDNSIVFGSEGSPIELTVHAFIEENEDDSEDAPEQYVNYQAIVRSFEPNRFYVGDLCANFREAVASVSKLMK